MTVLSLQQNTDEWYEWRRSKIGASDCPIIMGVSPFKTPLDLYNEKINGTKTFINKAMERGSSMEGEALVSFGVEMGVITNPQVFQHPEIEWMVASLDGWCEEGGFHVEVKCPNENVCKNIKLGIIPPYYQWQIQHQLCVANTSFGYLYVYDGLEGTLVKIDRDDQMIAKLLEKEREFFNLLQTETPPTSEDSMPLRSDSEWQDAVNAWKEAKRARMEAEELEKICKEGLIYLANNKNCAGGGVRLLQRTRQGAVDYSKIAALKGVNIDLYRKPSYTYWELSEW